MQKESDLYPPIKALLESQDYIVKSEIGAADVVGVRGEEPPVVVELKLNFSLALYHQAITRFSVTDFVYIAVQKPKGRQSRRTIKHNRSLCRRLQLGLIFVDETGKVELVCDPAPYAPRKSKVKKARLLKEFHERSGDPNKGGAQRTDLVTSYRQKAIRIAEYLLENGPSKGSIVKSAVDVPNATNMMADNHYGWFERVSRGIYALSEQGRSALAEWKEKV